MVLPWCHYNVCTQQRYEQANTAQDMHIGFWLVVLHGKALQTLLCYHMGLPYKLDLLSGFAF